MSDIFWIVIMFCRIRTVTLNVTSKKVINRSKLAHSIRVPFSAFRVFIEQYVSELLQVLR